MACPICFDAFDNDVRCAVAWGCGHVLCNTCSEKTMHATRRCPVCRTFLTRDPLQIFYPKTKLQECLENADGLTDDQACALASFAVDIGDDTTLCTIGRRDINRDVTTCEILYRKGDTAVSAALMQATETIIADSIRCWFDRAIAAEDVPCMEFLIRNARSSRLSFETAMARTESTRLVQLLLPRVDMDACLDNMLLTHPTHAFVAAKIALWNLTPLDLLRRTPLEVYERIERPTLYDLFDTARSISSALRLMSDDKAVLELYSSAFACDWNILHNHNGFIQSCNLPMETTESVIRTARDMSTHMVFEDMTELDKDVHLALVAGSFKDNDVEGDTLLRVWRYWRMF